MLGNDLTPEVPNFSGTDEHIVYMPGSGVDGVHIVLPKFHTNKEVFTALVDECLFLKTQCVKLKHLSFSLSLSHPIHGHPEHD